MNRKDLTPEQRDQRDEDIKAASRAMMTASPKTAPEPKRNFNRAYERGLESDALSVHPLQVEKFNKDMRNNGTTGAYYRKDGQFITHSRRARKKESERRNLFDADGGYGDPQRK